MLLCHFVKLFPAIVTNTFLSLFFHIGKQVVRKVVQILHKKGECQGCFGLFFSWEKIATCSEMTFQAEITIIILEMPFDVFMGFTVFL